MRTTSVAHDPAGKRVWKAMRKGSYVAAGPSTCEIYFYGMTGQKLVTYSCSFHDGEEGDGLFYLGTASGENTYFGGSLIQSKGVTVITDRLGSVRVNANGERFSYFPYGEQRTSTPDGREKFGTYTRDVGGLDYADQRYYATGTGRFLTVDPGGIRTADAANPISWNRYIYVGDDPVNFNDPNGLCWAIVSSGSTTWRDYYDCTQNYISLVPTPYRGLQPVNTVAKSDDIQGTGPAKNQIKDIYDIAIDARGANILKQVYGLTSGLTNPISWGGWAGSSIVASALVTGGFALLAEGGGIAVELDVASGAGTTAVIGSSDALKGALGPNGSKLMEVAQEFYSWATNKAILEATMSWGKPIRDLDGALEAIEGSMLSLEREVLKGGGWMLRQLEDGYYYWVKP